MRALVMMWFTLFPYRALRELRSHAVGVFCGGLLIDVTTYVYVPNTYPAHMKT